MTRMVDFDPDTSIIMVDSEVTMVYIAPSNDIADIVAEHLKFIKVPRTFIWWIWYQSLLMLSRYDRGQLMFWEDDPSASFVRNCEEVSKVYRRVCYEDFIPHEKLSKIPENDMCLNEKIILMSAYDFTKIECPSRQIADIILENNKKYIEIDIQFRAKFYMIMDSFIRCNRRIKGNIDILYDFDRFAKQKNDNQNSEPNNTSNNESKNEEQNADQNNKQKKMAKKYITKKFKCETCDLLFKDKYALTRHENSKRHQQKLNNLDIV